MVKLNFSKKKYSTELIKETAYLFTDKFWVLIETEKDDINVIMEQIDKDKNIKDLKNKFLEKLEEERIRDEIFNENIKLREYLIKQSMTYKDEDNEVSGLTKKEEEELEKLIKEVEAELKKESGGNDESEIKKTWEEKYEKK